MDNTPASTFAPTSYTQGQQTQTSPSSNQYIIEDDVTLFERDTVLPGGRGVGGHLSLDAQELRFSPASSTNSLIIAVTEISDVDFTNVVAKAQFIITHSGNKYVFGFIKPSSIKRTLWILIRPLNGVLSLKENTEATNKAFRWKNVFSQLTPKAFRTRKEIQLKNVLLGSLLAVVLLLTFFFILITISK